MSGSALVILAVVLVVVFGALFVFTTAARRDRDAAVATAEPAESEEAGDQAATALKGREVELAARREREGGGEVVVAAEAPPVIRAPVDPETLDVTRRQFLNRGIVAFFSFGLAGFGTAALGFLWPSLSGGFGSKITVGKADEVTEEINSARKPKYVAEARSWIALYPKDAVANAKKVYKGAVLEGMEIGFVALYQKCVHLGCRVPFCDASQWFECPCHGSRYNRVGEKTGGPAPRGLDRFALQVSGGTLVVDTSEIVDGPPIGTDTTGQGAEGPHCA